MSYYYDVDGGRCALIVKEWLAGINKVNTHASGKKVGLVDPEFSTRACAKDDLWTL